MSSTTHRWMFAALAISLVAALGGCFSAPKSATSGPNGTSSDAVAISHVAQKYILEDSFKRISEYLDGKEDKSGRIIERTDPKQRTGYYFIIDLAWRPGVVLPAGTQTVLEYIRRDSPSTQTKVFTFSSDTGTWPEIYLGLTGNDWNYTEYSIVAYQITLKDAQGKVLASTHSFLWSLPAAEAVASSGQTTAKTSP